MFFERTISTIRETARALRERFDSLWGYDVFIAYRRSDAQYYAEALHQQILAEHLDCFIDTKVYVPGDSLLNETNRQVSKSTVLVLIASPAINDVRELDWIEAEVDAYLASERRQGRHCRHWRNIRLGAIVDLGEAKPFSPYFSADPSIIVATIR